MKNTVLILMIFLLSVTVKAQEKYEQTAEIVASGGTFTLEKAVTAGGGVQKPGSPIDENGTTGQTIAGVRSIGANYALYSGFWTPADFAPTASSAVVGGQILTVDGAGIRNVQVTITFPSGEIRTTVSSGFGYYRFTDIPTGGIYVISVAAKKYTFSEPTQIRQVQDDVRDVNFTAE